jgi:DNA-binding response OmpR family regulator
LFVTDVLIVEDDPLIADLLQDALEGQGYHVSGIARTVEEAVQAATQQPPYFAVIDVKLARGGLGTDVGACLRKLMKTRIMFSTGNDNGANLTTLEGDAVMTKPYRLSDVGRGLEIIDEIAQFGQTQLAFPRNFRLLTPAVA